MPLAPLRSTYLHVKREKGYFSAQFSRYTVGVCEVIAVDSLFLSDVGGKL